MVRNVVEKINMMWDSASIYFVEIHAKYMHMQTSASLSHYYRIVLMFMLFKWRAIFKSLVSCTFLSETMKYRKWKLVMKLR